MQIIARLEDYALIPINPAGIGRTIQCTITLADGTFDPQNAYRLTIKHTGKYSHEAITYAALTLTSDTTATCSFTLSGDALYEYLGDDQYRMLGCSLDMVGAGVVAVGEMRLINTYHRADDSAPTDESENTYTDDEVDALITQIPASTLTSEQISALLALLGD